MNNNNGLTKTHRLVLTAILFSIAIVLSVVEDALPALPVAVPGIKFGLSNIVVMYSLFFINKRQAILIAVLKALFVLLTKGTVAAALSFSGGIVSLAVMTLFLILFKEKISYLSLSILGAVFHNIGQLTAVSFIYTSVYIWAYLPVLLIAGMIAGAATAALLRCSMPVLKKLNG